MQQQEAEEEPLQRGREWQRSASSRSTCRTNRGVTNASLAQHPNRVGSTASLVLVAGSRRGSLVPISTPLDHGELTKKHHHVQFRCTANGSGPKADGPPSTPSSSSSSSLGGSEIRAPDGGYGWVVVFASFMVNLIADGITFSFGVLYVELLNYFQETKSYTAWVGSLFMAMPLLSGPIASFLTDRYGCRKCCVVGGLLSATGFFLSSLTDSLELLFLFFGVIAGIGLSLCYVTAIVIVAYYFESKRSFATGLSVCGSGIGTFIFAPITTALLDIYDWQNTVLILAGFLLNLCVCGMLMRDLEWTKKKRKKFKNKKLVNAANSTESYSTSNVAIQPNHQPIPYLTVEELRQLLQKPDGIVSDIEIIVSPKDSEDNSRLFSSLVNLPTFVRNGEKVPIEVLEIMTANRPLSQVLLQNYPNLLISKSFSDSAKIHEQKISVNKETGLSARFLSASPECNDCAIRLNGGIPPSEDQAHTCWPRPKHHHYHQKCQGHQDKERKIPTAAYLKDLRVHRHSLTYRGAMLNINRYNLRASSCPDIYRNSMSAISKRKTECTSGLLDLWMLLKHTLDLSYFTNVRYLLFAISNFILYIWYDVPYVYIADYSKELGYSEKAGSWLISIIGILNMLGEIVLGWLGDQKWVNPSFVYALSMGLCGIVVGLVPLLRKYYEISIASGAFGVFIAANYALTSIILVEQITIERFTNAYGLLLLVQGMANLVGPPLAGELHAVHENYDLPFYLAGIFIALSGLLLIIPSMIDSCRAKPPPEPPEKSPNNV